jgi:hypothetical protein
VPRIDFSTWNALFESKTVLERDITFLGYTFTVNTAVTGRLKLNFYDLRAELGVSLPQIKGTTLGVGIVAGIKYLAGETSIKSDIYTQTQPLHGFIPQVGARGNLKILDFLGIEASIIGAKITNLQEVKNFNVFDLSLQVKWLVSSNMYIGLGYRSLAFQLEYEDQNVETKVDTTLDGLFFSIGVMF